MRTSKVVSLSMPPEVAQEFEDLAQQQSRSKSELFRDMLSIWKKFSGERERQEDNSISIMASRVLAEVAEEKRRGIVPTSEELNSEWEQWKNSDELAQIQKNLKARGITEDMVIEGNYGDAQ